MRIYYIYNIHISVYKYNIFFSSLILLHSTWRPFFNIILNSQSSSAIVHLFFTFNLIFNFGLKKHFVATLSDKLVGDACSPVFGCSVFLSSFDTNLVGHFHDSVCFFFFFTSSFLPLFKCLSSFRIPSLPVFFFYLFFSSFFVVWMRTMF